MLLAYDCGGLRIHRHACNGRLPALSARLSREDSLPRGQATPGFIREKNVMSPGVSNLHFWFTAARAGGDVSVSLIVSGLELFK